ncbi:MAG TPA: hypothetical protein PK883_08660 [Anaerolineaceae bacterium]|nr:hypothetical protein [Anaerolineaceae bacterium]
MTKGRKQTKAIIELIDQSNHQVRLGIDFMANLVKKVYFPKHISLLTKKEKYRVAEVDEVQRRLKNLDGIIKEFDEMYPVWRNQEEFEELNFSVDWDQAVGQFEFIQKLAMTEEQRLLFLEISSRIKDRISILQEKRLQIPDWI